MEDLTGGTEDLTGGIEDLTGGKTYLANRSSQEG
jgi:hypothetical protein